MPFGDSITQICAYRPRLWTLLSAAHPKRIDFVGGNGAASPCGAGDEDHEGHSGYLVTDLLTGKQHAAEFQTWLSATAPDVVIMHYGTNDVWNAKSTDQILEAYGFVVDEFRKRNPSVIFVVGQLIPMDPTSETCANCSCPTCGTRVDSLNHAIPAWASDKSTAKSPIVVVDQHAGFDISDTYDRVHPNDAGAAKMATKWMTAFEQMSW